MTIGANRKLKQCDPFNKRKVVDEKELKKDKPFKLKNDERIPRSLRMVMEASQLVKEIDEKKQKRREMYQENKEKNLQNNGVTGKEIKRQQQIKHREEKAAGKHDKNKDIKKQQKTDKKNKKIAKSVAGLDTSVAEEKKKTVEELTDYSQEKAKLARILGFMANPEDKGENTNLRSISNGKDDAKEDIQLDTSRRPGENQEQYYKRMQDQINEKEKKMTNRYIKNKENRKLKKLKQKLKKKGLKMVDNTGMLNQDDDDDEDEDEVENGENEQQSKNKTKPSTTTTPQDKEKKQKQQQQKLKHKNAKKDFDELQDEVKFGEQADRPPTLSAVKDLSKRKLANTTQSSKRKYLWQEEQQQQQQTQQEDEQSQDDKRLEEQRQIIKKQKLEVLRNQVMQNYKQNKLKTKQRNAIKAAENPSTKSQPRAFYL